MFCLSYNYLHELERGSIQWTIQRRLNGRLAQRYADITVDGAAQGATIASYCDFLTRISHLDIIYTQGIDLIDGLRTMSLLLLFLAKPKKKNSETI